MKCKINYHRGNAYGNDKEAKQYNVKLRCSPESQILEIEFQFTEPQRALGVGTGGRVEGCTITLPVAAAMAISHAIYVVQNKIVESEVKIQLNEAN